VELRITKMKIPVTKQISMRVANGELEILKEKGSYHVYYHNNIYVGSPFKLSNSYSLDFSMSEIAKDSSVLTLISRVTGDN
jgi:hypothetical protein